MTTGASPLQRFLEARGVLIVDGGLATALESSGHALQDDLWSARLLVEEPAAYRAVHRAYLDAGADCILTASYQATLQGFQRRGLSEAAAEELLRLSVELAVEARSDWQQSLPVTEPASASPPRPTPVVAASIGPYGAFLADGSEYHGNYGLTDAALRDFHLRRWEILASSQADLLACETIPSWQEVQVLLELLRRTPRSWGWMSVTCRDGTQLRDGSALRDVFATADQYDNLAAVGVNCTAPRYVARCIREIRRVTRKPIVVYPNSGEHFDVKRRTWGEAGTSPDWAQAARQWRALGAQGIGGCCRVGPAEIRTMRAALLRHGA